ncbi:MAG: 30S ribosomal protein S15 [Bacteroidales bacterium]|nr:30S ribosomal protein S15 [Bacteroidales bacterium]
MYLTPEVKKEIFTKFGKSEVDTGSPESQVALFTHRIKHLTEHLKANKKDIVTKRALMGLVGKRKKMMEYIKQQDIERYRAIVKQLGLRK